MGVLSDQVAIFQMHQRAFVYHRFVLFKSPTEELIFVALLSLGRTIG
jgi:hypothetical protein